MRALRQIKHDLRRPFIPNDSEDLPERAVACGARVGVCGNHEVTIAHMSVYLQSGRYTLSFFHP